MNRDLMLRAGKYKKRRKLRHLWKRIVSVLGCVVVFCTTYALILPAITQERESFCGIEAHIHAQECLVQGSEIDHYELMCSYETLGVHQHDDACYDDQKNLICTEIDYLIHVHDETCYREDGKFACMIPEVPPHEHTQECYQLLGGHVHGEECHAFTRGALICTLPEEEAHTHQEDCWMIGEQLLCGVESEHVHGSECYAAVSEYVCGYGQEHLHAEACYGPGTQLLCTAEEQHVHADECYISSQELICGFEQEHTHNEGCYSVSQICAVPENHFHQSSCFAPADLICTDASEEHQHADGCYGEPVLLCTTPEGHVHSEQCFEQILSCQITEHIHADCYAAPELACSKAENHTHTGSCYEQVLLCQEAEHVHTDACLAAPELLCTLSHVHTDDCREKLLQCTLAETAGHRHTDACYEQQIEWVCTLEETPGTETLVCEQPDVPVHIHSDSCYIPIYKYEVVCTLPEHTHQLSCYSDPTADVETERDWEKSFKHVTLTGVWEADVLAIAESQLGYHESTRNYIVLEDGVSTRGYTRYGAWYRAPYGDWCAMFASFCLHYAQVEGMPLEAHCQNWIKALSEPDVNLYHPVGTYTPKPGDLVFFEYDDDNNSDHVGLVVEYKEQLKTIEGNSAEVVRKVTYELDDPTIIGYGAIPELLNQAADDEAVSAVYYCGAEEHLHGEACSDAEGNFICIAVEHQHGEECLIKPEETPAPVVYYCGVEEHLHGEECSDAEGNFICVAAEHQHGEECLIKPEETPAPVVYYCGAEEHLHGEACSDAEGNFICIAVEHQHGEECLVKPEETPVVYYCGAEEHLHGEACSDAEGNFICIAVEHQHGEECLVKPEETPAPVVYYCGMEEHLHGETCLDSEGNFICTLTEHTHDDTCIIEPAPVTYHCGMVEHLHGEACLDSEGNFICTLTEHTHDDTCLIEPAPVTYHCGMEEHLHGETCLDSEGNFICTLTEHTHDDTCLIEPAPVTYHCGMEEHLHGETCLDSEGNFICTLTEHTHDDTCLIESAPVTYHCGMEEHLHGEACLDSEGNFICTLTEHTHDDTCLIEPAPVTYHCGMEEHLHGESCLDSEGNFICTLTEHTHNEGCLLKSKNAYFCGSVEHAHTEDCYGESGEMVCTLEEHTHTLVCSIDLSPFTQDVGRQICEVTVMIDKLLTIDQIEEKIQEYESVGDYEGEEAWMTELYQQVQNTYRCYALLPAEAQEAVPNRDKLLEMEFIWSIMPLAETLVGYAIPYGPEYFTSTGKFVFYTQGASGQYYAFDKDGNAIPVSVDANGMITISSDNEETLLWTLTGNGSDYFIQSVSNSRYMHAYPHSGSSVTTSGRNASVLEPVGTGLRVRSNSEYAYLDEASRIFRVTSDVNNAAVYSLGVIYNNHVWLDGTNGGLMSLYGSPDKAYPSSSPTFILPTTWESPTKYAYTLRGWYDVINGEYYAPGAPVTVTSNMVFYADWVAETYNIGQYNAHTADTISTNEFITVRVFDYSSMFNTLSTTAEVTVSADGHSEVWSMADDKEGSPGFIFRDWDRGSRDISYPADLTAVNDNGEVYQGLLTAQRRDLLFNPDTSFNPYTGEGVLGKQYLGKADHLFQYGESPSDGENYGYYYYDSHYNAASFHKDHGRFYVYDYLERTSDSQTNHSDFLPFNSPYVNTNGKTVSTYSYEGINGEYAGTTHYMYDAKDTGNGSDPSHVATNYWFGISMTMDFYLPNTPGTVDAEGNPANQSVHGDNMVFEFSGDDDVWVLIDGQVVLDLGGIHGDEFGSINFTTGEVIVNGANDGNVTDLEPGSHTLTMYYLERGSSMSNCKIRFNLSPRYTLTLQKEDVLTRDLLNGAKFAVYTDAACTVPAQLWPNQASHDRGEGARNEFTVANGKAVMWGLAAGTTYYMKEIQPPENREETVHGIVVMTLNNQGQASYSVIADHGELSGGFTVHGYRIDQETQEAYLVITNAENVTETTDIYVRKQWDDTLDHSGDSITVYLMVNGAVIREEELSAANNWEYLWSNMPKYLEDGVTPVSYVVREGTVPGYVGQIETTTEGSTATVWEERTGFVNGQTYLIRSYEGYLSASNNRTSFVSSEAEAASSPNSRWIATVRNNNTVTLKNESNHTLFYNGRNWRFVTRTNTSGGTTELTYSNGLFRAGSNSYMCNLASADHNLNASTRDHAVVYTPYQRVTVVNPLPEGATGYLIVNKPVADNETIFLTVTKQWKMGQFGTTAMYEQLNVNVKLLANGSDSGMRVQLNLKNGWTASFSNLPKKDSSGNLITYTVAETDVPGIWSPHYGEIVPVDGLKDTYTTTITNVNTLNYMLPETGGRGSGWYTLGGAALIAIASILLIGQLRTTRRKGERNSS